MGLYLNRGILDDKYVLGGVELFKELDKKAMTTCQNVICLILIFSNLFLIILKPTEESDDLIMNKYIKNTTQMM